MTAPNDIRYRPAGPEDRAAIVEQLSLSLGQGPTGQRSEEFFDWKHRLSPFGPSPAMLAEHDGRIVGVRLFLRWELTSPGGSVRAVRAVDTVTDPAYRGRGIFRELTLGLLKDLEIRGEVDLVFNTPNGNSRPGYLKMGWTRVGTLPVRLRLVHPGKVLRGAREAAGTTAMARPGRKKPSPGPDVHGLCTPFQPAHDVLAKRGMEIAALLERSERPSGLHTPKTLPYLAWRYGSAPGLDYRCLTSDRGQGLTGIAFGRLRRRGALTEFTLADVIVAQGDRRAGQQLLRSAARSGADHVAFHAMPGTQPARWAKRSGYLTVPHYGVDLVVNQRRGLTLDPRAPESWRLTLGDLEVF